MTSPLSITGRRWTLSPADSPRRFRIHSLHPLVARCLSARIGGADVADWLRPSFQHLHDPHRMLNMDRAVARLQRAVAERHRMRIVTDYDVDGTTSSLILQSLFRILGIGKLVDYHIPDRFVEGYGFSVQAAKKAAEDGVRIIVTADIGVKDHAAVTAAAEAGIDVIICDHHLPAGESVPVDAYAVLCPPQEGCAYPNKSLAACGVSLKLAQAMLPQNSPRTEKILLSMMKVAAIGTIADVVDLSGLENRAIVSLGLERLREGPNAPGLQALLDVSELSNGWIDAGDIGYKVSPRINAAGRLAAASTVVELFSARTRDEAYLLARQLDALNIKRQDIQRELVERCMAELSERDAAAQPHFSVLWGEESAGWHRGVVGIVASRVRDELHRPAAIISIGGGSARGSIRSTPAVHAVRALESASDLLEKFGGHPAAAGFSVHPDNIPALAERLDAFARQASSSAAPDLTLDAECAPSDINWSTVKALQKLGPHGKGNPRPLLWVRGVRPEGLRVFADKHLKFRVGTVEAIWWKGAKYIDRLQGTVDLAAEPGINRYRGRSSVRLTVQDAVSAVGATTGGTTRSPRR